MHNDFEPLFYLHIFLVLVLCALLKIQIDVV